MTSQPLDAIRLDEIATRAAHLYEYATSQDSEGDTLAGEDVPALLAEIQRLTDRVAELEKAAVNARDALGSLCYDLADPGTAALGALYLLTQATTWTETGPDFAAEALAQHSAKVLHGIADIADPEPPEVSFFGDHGPTVADWLRMLASRKPVTKEAGQ